MLDPLRVEAFYRFMIERESIRQRRLAGLPRESWTQDEIFKTFSFTNVKREHDRTTQLFLKRYRDQMKACDTVDDHQNNCDLFMSCAIYRYFGTDHSAEVLGPYTWARPDGRYKKEYFDELRNYGMQGDLSFTAAYIIPAAGRSEPKYEIVAEILEGIEKIHDQIVQHLYWQEHSRSWEYACHLLTSCYGVGSFMAKEILLDHILATGVKPSDWKTWTPVGPGGKRGASRIKRGWADKMSESEALDVIREVYELRDQYWPAFIVIDLPDDMEGSISVNTPKLDLTDIQFQFCEFDKYSRVGEGGKPKRKFRPTIDDITQAVVKING